MKKLVYGAITLVIVISSLPTAMAVYGGKLAVGSKYAVPIFTSNDSSNPFCSGVAIEPDVVVSAAHCFGKISSTGEELQFKISTLRVGEPGFDTSKNTLIDTVSVKFAVYPRMYQNYYDQEKGDWRSQKNDIIFFVLSRNLKSFTSIRIAQANEVDIAKQGNSPATFFGYGPTGPSRPKDGRPYRVDMKSAQARWPVNHPASLDETIYFDGNAETGLCGGDSGGPWFLKADTDPLLLAITIGANGCGATSQSVVASGTLIWPYLEEFRVKKSLMEEKLARIQQEMNLLISKGYKVAENSGCHSDLAHIEFKIYDGNEYRTVSEPMGYDSENCPIGMFHPWVAIEMKEGTKYAWKISAPNGEWTTFITEGIFVNLTAQKAKQEAEAKAVADIKAKQESADKAAATKKKTSITCVKGKLTKKVTAVKPKCPAGYKLKK